jgi:hypothetical protein
VVLAFTASGRSLEITRVASSRRLTPVERDGLRVPSKQSSTCTLLASPPKQTYHASVPRAQRDGTFGGTQRGSGQADVTLGGPVEAPEDLPGNG